MIKLVALDMDGTTLNSEGLISTANKDMIDYAMQKGIHIAIASNGATIYRTTDNSCILRHLLSASSVKTILSLVNHHKTDDLYISYEAFIDGVPYTDINYYDNPELFGATKWAVNYIHNTRTPVNDIIAFIFDNIDKLDCIDIIASNHDWTSQFINTLRDNINDIYVTSSVKNLIEISNINAGKGKALAYLADLLDIDLEDTCGIGDQDNDLDLLTTSGYGVAMGNATEAVKQAADFITTSNNEDGVAVALKKIIDEGL